MKKNNKINTNSLWWKRVKSPEFLKNLFVFVMITIIFVLSIILIWKKHAAKNTSRQEAPFQVTLYEEKEEVLEEKTSKLQNEVTSFSSRLSALENKALSQQQTLQVPQKLVALEILRGIQEGLVSLDALKTYLQKVMEPWAKPLLATLNPLGEIKSYPQLEALLILPAPSEPLSLWQRIKKKIFSLIHIRKLDEKGNYKVEELQDIQGALRTHDIQKALELFEKLPPEKKSQLSAWKKLAQDRWVLEKTSKELLLELAKG